jgi:hypothetical protein
MINCDELLKLCSREKTPKATSISNPIPAMVLVKLESVKGFPKRASGDNPDIKAGVELHVTSNLTTR